MVKWNKRTYYQNKNKTKMNQSCPMKMNAAFNCIDQTIFFVAELQIKNIEMKNIGEEKKLCMLHTTDAVYCNEKTNRQNFVLTCECV